MYPQDPNGKMASLGWHFPLHPCLSYAISKAGLEAMGRVWAGETEQTNLRINMINPGGTATGMRSSAFPGEDPDSLPQPDDIAPAFLTLLSPDCQDHGKRFEARSMLGL